MVEDVSITDDSPGRMRMRGEVAAPTAYAVFDCETTGTTPKLDEVVPIFWPSYTYRSGVSAVVPSGGYPTFCMQELLG